MIYQYVMINVGSILEEHFNESIIQRAYTTFLKSDIPTIRHHHLRLCVRASQSTKLDIRECNLRVRGLRLNVLRIAGIRSTCSSGHPRSAWVRIRRVWSVEPEHLRGVVVPNGQHKNHAGIEAIAHCVKATASLERVGVAENFLLLRAEVGGDFVGVVDASDVGDGVLNHLAVLHVDTLDRFEGPGVSAVGSDKFGNDSEFARGVHNLAWAVEALVAHAKGIEVAAVLVTDAVVAAVAITALSCTLADIQASLVARMWSVRGRNGVGFPDVHLVAAGAHVALAGVGVVLGRGPAFDVGLREEHQD